MADMVVEWVASGAEPCDICIAAESYYVGDECPVGHENCECEILEIDDQDLIEGFTVDWQNITGYDSPDGTYEVCVDEEDVENCDPWADEIDLTYRLEDYNYETIEGEADSLEDEVADMVVTEVDEDEVEIGIPPGLEGTVLVTLRVASYTIEADAIVDIDGTEYNAGTYSVYAEQGYSITATSDLAPCD
jgi:hypothetical protein